MSKPDVTQLAVAAVNQAGAAATPATVTQAGTAAVPTGTAAPPPDSAAAVTATAATPGAGPPDAAVLSDDEKSLLESLILKERHHNFYRYAGESPPYYLGWFYLTNLLWYLRTSLNKNGERLTSDQSADLLKVYGARGNAIIPAKPTPKDPEIPRNWPKDPPDAWFRLMFGGIIPHTQAALAKIRRLYTEDIKTVNGVYQSSSTTRSYRAKDHNDPVKDAAADARRLELLMHAIKYLGAEYQQSHPENQPRWKAMGRTRTLDCSGFTARVYADAKVLVDERTKSVIDLGSQVSSQYFKAITFPETLRIVKGPRCKLLAGAPRRNYGSPLIEETVEDVPFDGTVLTGDLGLTRMKKRPQRSDNGTVDSDFGHIVMFTGRRVDDNYECIHASDIGECVDFGSKSIADVAVLIRPKL